MQQKYYISGNRNKIFEFDFVPKKPFTYKGGAEAALEDFDKKNDMSARLLEILEEDPITVTLITPCGERTFSVERYTIPAYRAEEVK